MATKNLPATRESADLVPADSRPPERLHGQVDPQDEPSVEWGWHGGFPVMTRVAAWFTAIALLAMNYGNHRGWVEDVYLDVIGIGIIVLLIADLLRKRTAWRR